MNRFTDSYGSRASSEGDDPDVRPGNRWDLFVDYMREHGWDKDAPAHVEVDLQGRARLSEGNHRVGVAIELGRAVVPVEFHYVGRVSWSKHRF